MTIIQHKINVDPFHKRQRYFSIHFPLLAHFIPHKELYIREGSEHARCNPKVSFVSVEVNNTRKKTRCSGMESILFLGNFEGGR